MRRAHKWIEYDTHGANHYKTDTHPDWYHGPKYSNGQVPFSIGHWGGDTDGPGLWADWCVDSPVPPPIIHCNGFASFRGLAH